MTSNSLKASWKTIKIEDSDDIAKPNITTGNDSFGRYQLVNEANTAPKRGPNIIKMGIDIFPGYEFGKTLDLNSLSTISKKNEKNFKYLFLVSLKDIDPGQELVAQYTFYQF